MIRIGELVDILSVLPQDVDVFIVTHGNRVFIYTLPISQEGGVSSIDKTVINSANDNEIEPNGD